MYVQKTVYPCGKRLKSVGITVSGQKDKYVS